MYIDRSNIDNMEVVLKDIDYGECFMIGKDIYMKGQLMDHSDCVINLITGSIHERDNFGMVKPLDAKLTISYIPKPDWREL